MEKIYMNEENGQKQGKRSVNASVVLSLLVAVFAIAALITVGFNQISFAKPLDPEAKQFKSAAHADRIYRKGYSAGEYNVTMYYDETGEVQVFCIEHKKDYAGDTIYARNTQITDYGLLHILANTLASGKYVTQDHNKYVETWVAQTAIWEYLYQLDEDELEVAQATTELVAIVNNTEQVEAGDPSVNLYNTYVAPLVNEARNKKAAGFVIVKKTDDKLSKVDDGKYYQTSAITVTADSTDDMKSFTAWTDGIDGAYVVGEDGKKIEKGDTINLGTKIFVKIPADKVKDVKKNLALNVDAVFDMYAGYIYSDSNDSQDVVTVEDQDAHILGGTVFEIIGTPDTGMNTAQTIYFIGLVVLLCGVGIIYANAKPVKKQTQE